MISDVAKFEQPADDIFIVKWLPRAFRDLIAVRQTIAGADLVLIR
jgi:hypothetical protein